MINMHELQEKDNFPHIAEALCQSGAVITYCLYISITICTEQNKKHTTIARSDDTLDKLIGLCTDQQSKYFK